MIAQGLQAMAFLVGHCWLGQLSTPGQVDRHCFSATADGAIRDHNLVTDHGRRLLAGESVYRWDGTVIAVTYRDTSGGQASGAVKVRGAMFGAAMHYVTRDAQGMAIMATWTRIGDAAYRADLRFPELPRLNETILYRRVD